MCTSYIHHCAASGQSGVFPHPQASYCMCDKRHSLFSYYKHDKQNQVKLDNCLHSLEIYMMAHVNTTEKKFTCFDYMALGVQVQPYVERSVTTCGWS